MSTNAEPHLQAGVVGLGLIGGSVALALGELGYAVFGDDADEAVREQALASGVVQGIGIPSEVDVVFLATPVDMVPEAARRMLATTSAWVTDTGSVKGSIVDEVNDPRFVGGHPMAGSEQSGLAGARPDLFRGAVWVLTPSDATSDSAFAAVHELVAKFGADPITVAADSHDRIVATVSHVPHLTAAALMTVASQRSDEHLAMLRLAAGGFRDMTRIASGSPDIWPPICVHNAPAITEALDEVIDTLATLRAAVEAHDSETIRTTLTTARAARRNLPTAVPLPENLAEVRVRVNDERGELASLTALAAELDVNIYDLEIAHSAEGPTGVVVLLINSAVSDRLRGGLLARGYRPSIRVLT